MSQEWIYTFVFLAWLAGAAAFVLGLHQMNSPGHGAQRQPALRRRHDRWRSWPRSSGWRSGRAASAIDRHRHHRRRLPHRRRHRPVPGARAWQMTAMPQLVSLFNAVGGGAAALVAIDDYLRIVGHARADRLDRHLRGPGRGHRLRHVLRLADRRRASCRASSRASPSRSRARPADDLALRSSRVAGLLAPGARRGRAIVVLLTRDIQRGDPGRRRRWPRCSSA